ncbi:MAG: leucine-rich repeat domain-containing protein [Lachnospiraceae bacterium]|nr:leucine-rich repeat domain-containing protein [Lachnospiraceae bacterium]
MTNLNEIITNFDFCHCVEREGFIFTSIDKPANVLDAIVIRYPENSNSITPQKSFSKKSLEEHIEVINKYKLEKACIIAENIEFIHRCPSLKCFQIIPAKSAPDQFDYSPLYDIPEIKYLTAITEYRDHFEPTVTTLDYSRINGLKEVWMSGKGHLNFKELELVEYMDISNMAISDFDDMSSYESLKRLDILRTGINSLRGIGNFKKLQWLSVDYERKLSDMSEISKISNTLRALSIENCPKITDFSFLNQMHNLEHLSLFGKNKLMNLNFLFKMPNLKTFTFSMEIESGDLTPCLNIPYVWCKKGKKHYNLKDRDLPKNDSIGGFELL